MIKIKNFPKNSRLTFLGSIFKDIKSKKIKVEDVFKKENKDIVAEAMAKNKKEVM